MRGGARNGAGRKKITDESQRKIKKNVVYLGSRYTEQEKKEMEKEIEKLKSKNKLTKAEAVYLRIIKKL